MILVNSKVSPIQLDKIVFLDNILITIVISPLLIEQNELERFTIFHGNSHYFYGPLSEGSHQPTRVVAPPSTIVISIISPSYSTYLHQVNAIQGGAHIGM